MENIFSKKIIFHVTFPVVWFKVNYFSQKKRKISTELFTNEKNQMIIAEIDIDQMKGSI